MNEKKILITGANGLLGQKTCELFCNETSHTLILTDIHNEPAVSRSYEYFKMDITNKESVKQAVRKFNPEVIINTAAFTNVDACETEKEHSWRVNADAVKNLIIASRINNCKIIQISTDYIFDGKTGNYTEDSKPNPINHYGKTKLAAENSLITSGVQYVIVRTMILYGTGKNIRPNFALWLIDMLSKGNQVKVVEDQFGMPTIVDDLAWGLVKIVNLNKTGIYNISGVEYISRYNFAVRLAEIFKFDENLILPIKTSELNQAAERPMNSSFVLLKAQTELGIKPLNVTEGLELLKIQIEQLN